MARRSTGVPEWFDLANYDSLRDATLRDWLVELTNRKWAFHVLRDSSLPDGDDLFDRALRHARYLWDRIKSHGSLTGRHQATLKTIYSALHESEDQSPPAPYEPAAWKVDEAKHLMSIGEWPDTGRWVSPLTKGEAATRLWVAGEIDGLSLPDDYRRPDERLIRLCGSVSPLDLVGRETFRNERFLRVDLEAPDELLEAEFDAWLSLQRQRQASSGEITPRMASEADFADWCKYRVLPYIDLAFAMDYEGFRLTQERLGDLLFPDEPDVSIAERIRKVTRPKALAVFSHSFIRGLARQYEHSCADRNE